MVVRQLIGGMHVERSDIYLHAFRHGLDYDTAGSAIFYDMNDTCIG